MNHENEDPGVLSIKSGELKAPGDVDIGQANGQWKWTGINPSSVGLACLVPNRLVQVVFMVYNVHVHVKA